MTNTPIKKGLDGVVVAETKICKVDGEAGKLYYFGYSLDDLERYTSFEETTYLLLYGHLPSTSDLKNFTARMRTSRRIGPAILDMVKNFPRQSHPMELLQSTINFLSGYVDHQIEHSATCNCRKTLHQIAQLPTIIAAFHRLRIGRDYIPPRDDLSHGANFLYMLTGEVPPEDEGEIMDKCLVLHAEHGMNASTFTARVVASTLSTCYCSISAAIGALFGSLHGGANEKVMRMLQEINSVKAVPSFIRETLKSKRKIMGMGHRVYRAKDPRSVIMERYLQKLSEKRQNFSNYEILKAVESEFRKTMDSKKKPIYPNVDFFSGSVYDHLGIPPSLFTPIFAMARIVGWLAHVLEQRGDNRIYRPRRNSAAKWIAPLLK